PAHPRRIPVSRFVVVWGQTPEIFVFRKFPGLSPNFSPRLHSPNLEQKFGDRPGNFTEQKFQGSVPLNQIEQAETRHIESLEQLSPPHLLLEHRELRSRHRRSKGIQLAV